MFGVAHSGAVDSGEQLKNQRIVIGCLAVMEYPQQQIYSRGRGRVSHRDK